MPISDDRRDRLSLQLIARIENAIKEFYLEKKIAPNEIPELLDHLVLSRLARNLGLNVRVEKSEITPKTAKKTPLGIEVILGNLDNRPSMVVGGKDVDTKVEKSPLFCERDLLY